MVVVGIEKELTIDELLNVAKGERVALSKRTLSVLARRRREVVSYITRSRAPSYGFNRGFGHNADVPVPPNQLLQLQSNIIRSHSCGSGEPLPIPVVRAAILLRANSLARGHSGVRPEVVQALVRLLNAGITPFVPSFGSVGASGDLAPLSHIALVLTGEGKVFEPNSSRLVPTKRAFARAGIVPLELEMKEGLALNNGVQVATALGILAYAELAVFLKTAVASTAIVTQVLLGSEEPFEPALHELRPHRGAKVVASWLSSLMKDSPMREIHRDHDVDGEVQDPYSLRCAPQILGTCYDLLEEARATFEIEMNSATDNPLLLKDRTGRFTRIVSGGHFHGMPVAVKLYNLIQAMSIMCTLANTRCARFVDQARNRGLGSDLIWPALAPDDRSASSGMMVPEYLSAALANEVWGAAMPSHLFSIPTDAGQEDHVSMSTTLGVRVYNTLPRLAEALGVELMFGLQALAIREQMSSIPSRKSVPEHPEIRVAVNKLEAQVNRVMKRSGHRARVKIETEYPVGRMSQRLSPPCGKIVARLRKNFRTISVDRPLTEDLQKLVSAVQAGEVIRGIRF